MNTLHQALTETYDELRSILREPPRPTQALERIRALGQRHPNIDFDLVWEDQPYDGSVEYSAILNTAGEGALSVSISPEKALPWPLRGVHRYDEADLLRVNGVLMQIGEAIQLMDAVWRNEDLLRRLVEACLLREALGDDVPEVTDEQLQRAMDEFRREYGLHTAAEMEAWLKNMGLDQFRLEEILCEQVAVDGLREQVTASMVEDYFAAHQHDLTICRLRRVTARTESLCVAIIDRARANGDGLLPAAAAMDGKDSDHILSIEVLEARRCELPVEATPPVDAAVGVIFGPMLVGDRWCAFELTATESPAIDAATRDYCQRMLFQRWLDERRAGARIEWYWGSQDETRSAGTQSLS
jgi:putative peptide maturation system protein